MNLVTGHDDIVQGWLAARYDVHVRRQPAVSIGVIDREGVLRGAFVVTWDNETTAELHLYGRTSNDTWRELFRWLFEVQRVYRLVIRTAKTNGAIKRAAPKFGFRFEGVERDYYGRRKDALRFYMTPPTCRWLRKEDEHGQFVQIA